MKLIRNTATHRIYEYIYAHPGCTRREILAIFPPDTNPRKVGILLSNLKKAQAIVNKGGATNGARWHPVETQVDAHYIHIANKLMNELEAAHPAIREVYLARRLQEIFDA